MTDKNVTSVLVANRGEIARRVFATCRRLGIGTVAVYSDPDSGAPHVGEADVAVRLPGNTSAETYLDAAKVIAAALAAGADAVHPGYGFLSENAEFAQAVLDAGLTWIGPDPAAIVAMGSKVNAKAMMSQAGVPTLDNLDPATVTADQLPVLIKASAGGGGRGMRIVRDLGQLAEQVEGARREALSAFGDDTVFCEPFIERGHHIEVQVLGDNDGTMWAVGERECSIQRRHQKVIEEAPSPLVERVGTGLRDKLFDAARAAASAIGYTGAGTVEFLADDDGRFYFLEMNTRLQVEHPVTEETTKLDLVAWQLQIARGDLLPPHPPQLRGHSIEVRLYAEDPAADWQPQSGRFHRFAVAADVRFGRLTEPGVRVDSGMIDGGEVSTLYDPMLAKVISWAPDRNSAINILARALASAQLHGPRTNRDMLVNMLRHPDFRSGNTTTKFIDEVGLDVLAAPLADDSQVRLAAVAVALADAEINRRRSGRPLPSGWRNLASSPQSKSYQYGEREISVDYRHTRDGVVLPDDPGVTVTRIDSDAVVLTVSGVDRKFTVGRNGESVWADFAGGSVALVRQARFVDPAEVNAPGSLLAPMPGSVIRVAVTLGQQVTRGEPLMWLEAMKMEHTIAATADGIVEELPVAPGQQVSVGEILAVIAESN
ncbi:biotin carboxylase N-terminal domain-containing protein [Nocardia sp. 348MFTsu5.1]|uniref:acetyl/propionyl/methylcrotonyl-CoA carboxylase subunit alpha n=1 Tax=Nocardia sp. 348MFTsu5.1 TaxID=1172185 RepID=UPI000381A639|nr:biotin carboxylase N-terminal domain-containing protein [Nocardia sp. 348MFTsu5.1]